MEQLRRMRRAALALLLCLLLAGCSGGTETPAADAPQDAARSAETPEATSVLTPQPETKERPEVENNGGFFVRVGEQVWFRRFEDGALDETCLWGDFLTERPSHAVASELWYYDKTGDAYLDAMADDGFGPLWFGVDGFYLTRTREDGSTEAYFRSLDGAETVLREGVVSGVSDDGRFAVLSAASSADYGSLYVYEGTEARQTLSGGEGSFYQFCGVTNEGTAVSLLSESGGGAWTLCAVDADGTSRTLGTLPELRPEDYPYALAPELEQCLIDGEDVWCSFGGYDGTGHFLTEVLCVRAKVGAEDSLAVVETDTGTAGEMYVPRLVKGADGEVLPVEHAPGELALSEGLSGDLIWYDGLGDERVLVPGMIAEEDEDGSRQFVQTMETVDGTVYLVVADAFRNEEEDVGWRTAYDPGLLYYLCLPLTEGAEPETMIGAPWQGASPAGALYQSFAGTWVLTGTEVEGDRDDQLPEGLFEYLDFREDGTVKLESTGTEDELHEVFTHRQIVPVNGVSDGASAYGLMLTGDENEDMLYAFFEGDTLVGTLMLASGADAMSRTGFYERSEG